MHTISKLVFVLLVVAVFGCGVEALSQKMPRPKLKLVGVTDTTGLNDRPAKMYEVTIENHAEYDNDLFISSPALPACGKTEGASRTWVNIYNELDQRIYGHCLISSNRELVSIKFILPATRKPKEIFVDFVDRFEGVVSRSKNVKVP